MLCINKTTCNETVDFAAQELKKYLRMMIPNGGDITITYSPTIRDGYNLGLMQDLALDVSDAKDTALDDILYIDTDGSGGIIAGANPITSSIMESSARTLNVPTTIFTRSSLCSLGLYFTLMKIYMFP